MPFYDFECQKCKHVYEDLCHYDDAGKYPGVTCPKCKSKRKVRIFGNCNVTLKGTSSTSHEVAFGYKYEQAQEDRRRAEQTSHMGLPYNPIDDLNSGKHFGEVR